MSLKLFDSHAHYFDLRFDGMADDILTNDVFGGNVEGVINIGTNNQTNVICINQAHRYEGMYAAVGIHPEDCGDCTLAPDEEIAVLEKIILEENKNPDGRVVAVGEIGYDFHMECFDRELQAVYFEKQMALAERLGLPVVIHDRESHGPCLDTVKKFPNVKGVFHSFSGSAEMAKELVRLGWYISFSGVLTFKNARKTVEVAEIIPLDRILIETDAPYLAPHPHRGKLNHSGLMVHTAEKLAEIKGISLEDVAKITRENVKALFGV